LEILTRCRRVFCLYALGCNRRQAIRTRAISRIGTPASDSNFATPRPIWPAAPVMRIIELILIRSLLNRDCGRAVAGRGHDQMHVRNILSTPGASDRAEAVTVRAAPRGIIRL
jgi:hypothetical protein